MPESFADMKRLLARAWKEWNDDQAPRLGAALSFYTTLSLAPLLVLTIAVAGLVFGEQEAQGRLMQEITNLVGPEGATAVNSMVENAARPGAGIVASLIGFITLLFGASKVAAELKESLNLIWDRGTSEGGILATVKHRSSALVVVLGCGFLLLVSLAVSSFLAGAGAYVAEMLNLPRGVLHLFSVFLSFVVITGVFSVLFRFLPDVDVTWRDVLPGAAFTALLFVIGKSLLGIYLGQASFGSAYGAAGSFVIVLVWVYYSSQIFFFGAEFTQVYAEERGSDPLGRRAERQALKGPVDTRPKTGVAVSLLPQSASWGNAAQNGNKSSSVVGGLLGSALAATKIFRGFRR